MRKIVKRTIWALLGILLLGVIGFVVWGLWIPAPQPAARAAMQSTDAVVVETAPWLVFRPRAHPPTTGLILYPGARVDGRAYAPTAASLAQQGFLVVIVPMPLNFAVLAPNRAAAVPAVFPTVRHWAIGGHSLGGAMAAQYAAEHPAAVEGLVLWAAYPPSGAPLTTQPITVVSIYGTRDGLARPAKIAASWPLLPPTTTRVAIAGGNHAQFGWYGPQSGDNAATISAADQQAQITSATADLLQRLDYGPAAAP